MTDDIKMSKHFNRLMKDTLDNMLEGAQMIDFNWRYIYVNDAVTRHGKVKKEQLLGRTMMEVYPGIEKTEMFDVLKKCMLERKTSYIENKFVYPDGSVSWFELSIQPIPDGVFILSIDISERKKAEENVKRLNKVYAVLSNINQAIVRIKDKKQLLDEACRIIVEDGKTRFAWVGFIDELTQSIYPFAKYGYDEGYLDKLGIFVDLVSGTSPLAVCIRENKHQWLNIQDADESGPWKKAALEREYRSASVFPLNAGGKVIGAITIYAGEADYFNEEEIKLLDELASDVSFSLDTMRIEEQRNIADIRLKESEGRYRGLFEHMTEGYAYCRMLYEKGEPCDWIYVDVNEMFEKLTGLKDVKGRLVSEVIPDIKKSDPKLFEIYSRVALTGIHEKFEMFVESLKMWFSISVYSPEKEFFVAVFDVITERKLNEEKIAESEKRLRAFYESGLVGVIYWNMDGQIVRANDKFLSMVGYSRDELNAGKIDWINMTPPEYRYLDDLSTAELKAAGVNRTPFEKEYIRKDGSRVPILVAGAMTDENRFNGVAFVLDMTERKFVEEALKESENKFLTAFNRSPFAMAISSVTEKKYLDVNDVFIKDSGYSREEIIGKTSEELEFFSDINERDSLVEEAIRKGFIYAKEMKLRMKSGKVLDCLISISLIQISGKPHLLTSIVDITDRKHMELAVQDSESKLSNAMKLAHLGHWEFDIATGLFTFNDHFYALFRTTAEKEGGYTMTPPEYANRFVHPDDRGMVEVEVIKSLEHVGTEYQNQLEHRIIYADGEIGYISVRFYSIKDANGRAIKNIGVNQDITERKKADELLHEQNLLLQTLINNSPDLIYIKDEQSRFRMASNSVAEFMGTTPEKLIGKSDFDFYPKKLAEKFYCDEKNIIESGKSLLNMEEPRLNEDGTSTWILTTKVPLYSKSGKASGILGVSKDITKIKQDELSIRHLNRVYSVLSNINKAIVRIHNKKELMDEVCRIIVEDGKARMVWIGFIDENVQKVIPFSKFGFDNGYLDNIDISTLDIPTGRGPIGRCIRDDKNFFINDVKNDPRMDPWKEAALERGYNSVCSFPLKTGGKVIGAISIYANEVNFFNEDEIKLMEELAGDISFALETIELNERRKIAEQKILEDELILNALVNNIPESVLLTDIEGNIIYSNDIVAKRFGTSQEKLIGTNTFNLVEKDVGETRKMKIKEAVVSGKQVKFQDKRNGRYIDNYINPVFNQEGNVTRLAILGIDRTESIKADDEIKKSEQLLRFHVENTPLGVVEWDTDFRVKRWNHSAEKIFGYTESEAIGKHASFIVAPESKQVVDDSWEGLLNNSGGFRSTNSNLNKDGDIIICSWYNTPLLDKDGKVMRVLSLVDDITEKVKAENELKISLDERELLLKEIHHRVKNNLQVVASLLKIQAEHVKDEASKGYFKISADRVRAMALIHQQLYGSTNLSRINFEYYLRNLASHLYNLYCQKPEGIKMNLKARGVTMSIDNAVPCGLLVNEILTNSLKYAFPDNRKGEINVNLEMTGDQYILEISDNGIGMSQEVDFATEKTLGVQLIQMLVEQLDATMDIKRSKGTSFKIKFSAFTYKKRV